MKNIDVKKELANFVETKQFSEMDKETAEIAASLWNKGLLHRIGGHDGEGAYIISLEGELAMGTPPDWWINLSKTEKATKSYERTEKDYLNITLERNDFVAGEFDNISIIFDMIKKGIIKLKENEHNRHSGMFTSLHLEITPAGRQALKGGE